MQQGAPSEAALRRYLLRLTPEWARAKWHRRLVEDARLFEQLAAAEDELILDYLQGRLSWLERWFFRRQYLKTRSGLTAVEMVRRRCPPLSAGNAGTPRSPGRPPLSWPALAVISATLALAVVWIQPRPAERRMGAELDVFELAPRPLRGESARENLVRPAPGRGVRLRIVERSGAPCPNPKAALQNTDTGDAPTLLAARAERADTGVAYVVDLRSDQLRPGDYILDILRGGGAAGDACASGNFRVPAPDAAGTRPGSLPDSNPGQSGSRPALPTRR